MSVKESIINALEIMTVDKVQPILDKLYQWLDTKMLTETEYAEILNFIQDKFSDYIDKHLGQRMDERKLGGFALYLYRQKDTAHKWAKKHLQKHFPNSVLEDNGIDNSGRVIVEFDCPKSEVKAADYKVGDQLLEVKDGQLAFNKGTYKVADLQAYIASNTMIVTIHKEFYTLITPEQQQMMLDKLEHKKYREVGYKLGVQIVDNWTDFGIIKWNME